MNRFAAVLTASMVLLGGCSAVASASSTAGSNASVTEYQQKTTVPVTPKDKSDGKDQGVNGVNGSGGGSNTGNSGNTGSGSSSPEATQSAGTGSGSSGVAGLPFTGFDVLALAGIGALLLIAGLAQRRFTADRRHA